MMKEETIVRQNMMDNINYRPYCGSVFPLHPNYKSCSSPRTIWSSGRNQMLCPECKWASEFPREFIDRYKTKHDL